MNTPRTDAIADKIVASPKMTALARTLERELITMSELHGDALVERNASRAECQRLREALERLTRIASVELSVSRPDVIEYARAALQVTP